MKAQGGLKVAMGKTMLTECLAAERTVLANERTFLSFLRTALTLFVAGVTFIRFFGYLELEILGWIFIPVSIIILILGALRYKKTRQSIIELEMTCYYTTENLPQDKV